MCPAVQDAVGRLCCAWWTAGAPDKDELLSQTLPFLLVGCKRPRSMPCTCLACALVRPEPAA